MGIIRTVRGWSVDYYINGRRVQEYVSKSKTIARQALDKIKGDIANGKYFPNKARGGDLTVSQVMDYYWKNHLQYKKSARYSFAFREAVRVFGRFTLSGLQAGDVEQYQRDTLGRPRISRRKGGGPQRAADGTVLTVKPGTVNRVVQALGAGLQYAIKRRLVQGYENPVSLVKSLPENNTRDVILDETQFNTFYRCLPEWLKPVLAFAYYTGCRKSEVLGLKKSDVDFFQNTVYIRGPKNDENRYIPIAPELKETLLSLVRANPESPYVFNRVDRRGKAWPIRDLKKAWYKARKKAQLEHVVFHDNRHTALTNWALAGHPESLIMQASGHKTRSCFKRYLSFKNPALQRLVLKKDSGDLEAGRVAEIAKAV